MVAVRDRRDGWWSDRCCTAGFCKRVGSWQKTLVREKQKPSEHAARRALARVSLDTAAFVRDGRRRYDVDLDEDLGNFEALLAESRFEGIHDARIEVASGSLYDGVSCFE